MTRLVISTGAAIQVIENDHSSIELNSSTSEQTAISFNYDERGHSSIALDEGDTFQCGKCQGIFPFLDFITHKKIKCSADSNLEDNIDRDLPCEREPRATSDRKRRIADFERVRPSYGADCFGGERHKALQTVLRDEKRDRACGYCGKTFKKSYDLKQHVRCHTGERPFMCVICGRAFKQKNNVDKHMDTHKDWPVALDNIPPVEALTATNGGMSAFICPFCAETFVKHSEWKNHLKVHVDRKVYKCTQENCSSTFTNRELFITHRQSHEGQGKFTCHVCSKQYSTLVLLSQHQITHLNEPSRKTKCNKCECVHSPNQEHSCRRYTCPLCDHSFAAPRFLRRHFAVHSTTNDHLCNDCGKCFKTTKLLASHRVSHTKARPHVCTVCSTAFKRREKLTRHQKIHEKSNKLKCHSCTKEFSRKDKLRSHLIKNHLKQVGESNFA